MSQTLGSPMTFIYHFSFLLKFPQCFFIGIFKTRNNERAISTTKKRPACTRSVVKSEQSNIHLEGLSPVQKVKLQSAEKLQYVKKSSYMYYFRNLPTFSFQKATN